MSEREELEVDVLIAGGGMAGLACAIRLIDAVRAHNEAHPDSKLEEPTVLVLEKGPSLGAHILSGCVLDPRALNELLPDWKSLKSPIEQPVTAEEISLLTKGSKYDLPSFAVPNYLHNKGNYVVSLGEVVTWLGAQASARGIEILEGVGGSQVLYDPTDPKRVIGVRCSESGLDKQGRPGANYQPGAEIKAKVTVFAEGVRGSLTKQLFKQLGLTENAAPQSFATGIKELWELPTGTFPAGKIVHTLGFPLQRFPYGLRRDDAFGGSFVYGLDDRHVVLGLVVGLDYKNPYLDPQREFQRLKRHTYFAGLLSSGKLVAYGAKAIPEGGYYALPRYHGTGFLIVGDAAGFLNAARLKGAHLAMKSGLLAADTIAEGLIKNKLDAEHLANYQKYFEASWAREEMYRVRNWRAAYAQGLLRGSILETIQRFTGGKGICDPLPVEPDHACMESKNNFAEPLATAPDGKLTFDKISSVYHSGTIHGEHQPIHLVVLDPKLCVERCTSEFGNPCRNFCPAQVYNWVEADRGSTGYLRIDAGNCVHCKTCDIKDPYENIDWTMPEGGDGPRYRRL